MTVYSKVFDANDEFSGRSHSTGSLREVMNLWEIRGYEFSEPEVRDVDGDFLVLTRGLDCDGNTVELWVELY